jgi:shikimate dehydrogenase
MPEISGTTRLVVIMADPIAHVRTVQAMNALFARRGTDTVIVPCHVGGDDLARAVAGLRAIRNFTGAVITVPHKAAALHLCDTLGDEARLVGAVNGLRVLPDGSLAGQMFDGQGFVRGLQAEGIDPAGHHALVIGAGGAASAVAVSLARAGVASLAIANRTIAKAEELAERIAAAFPAVAVSAGPASGAGKTLVVNGTSLGLAEGDRLPLDPESLAAGTIVAEVVMTPETTALLHAAKLRGCRIHLGRHMLAGQLEPLADFVSGA